MKACIIQPPYSTDTSHSDEYFDFKLQMLDKAHEHGIKCNVFFSDDPKETLDFLNMSIDTILTNDCNLISQCVER